jgi:hypothetical protein
MTDDLKEETDTSVPTSIEGSLSGTSRISAQNRAVVLGAARRAAGIVGSSTLTVVLDVVPALTLDERRRLQVTLQKAAESGASAAEVASQVKAEVPKAGPLTRGLSSTTVVAWLSFVLLLLSVYQQYFPSEPAPTRAQLEEVQLLKEIAQLLREGPTQEQPVPPDIVRDGRPNV